MARPERQDLTTINYDASLKKGNPVDDQPLTLTTTSTQVEDFDNTTQALNELSRRRRLNQAATVIFSATAAGSILVGAGEIFRGVTSKNLAKTAKGILAIGAAVGAAIVAEQQSLGTEEIDAKKRVAGWANFSAKAGIGEKSRTSVFK